MEYKRLLFITTSHDYYTPIYEVYMGYIAFAFSDRMLVCVSVNFFTTTT